MRQAIAIDPAISVMNPAATRFVPPAKAGLSTQVDAPARLHLGFLDPSATLGRRFASLGLVIEGMSTRLAVSAARCNEVVLGEVVGDSASDAAGTPAQHCAERLARYLLLLQRETGMAQPVRVTLHGVPPAHAGFGSGTQLALAVGRAFASFHGLDLGTRRIASLLGRGERSGVGIAGFDRGGLLLDGGPAADGAVAPLLARVAFPRDWRVLLVLDPELDGLHGSAECSAMKHLAPFPRELAAELCHQAVMRVLPAAIEGDFVPFAEGVSTVQRLIGDYFAPAQGGSMYTSPAVGCLLEWIRARYPAGIGQSSWGPTGFAILPSLENAEAVVSAAHAAGVVAPGLRLEVVRGRNQGAMVKSMSKDWLPRLAAVRRTSRAAGRIRATT